MDICGTIINLEEFLHNKESKLNIQTNSGVSEVKTLAENRKYNIPSFQRELRWGKQQVIELIRDISKNSIFLGNIILKQGEGNLYDIIDGQQRITILLMILDYIRNKYNEELDIFEQCLLNIENFPNFSLLRDNHYSFDELDDNKISQIKDSDYYKQSDSYCLVYKEIVECKIIDNKEKVASFFQNLKNSVFNVIISNDNSGNKGMQYFLDVNLKGVQLDDEDIFASYLYSIDSGEEIKQSWRRLKELKFQFNEGFGNKKYEIVDMLLHFLYCDLYLNPKYKNIQFKGNFLLKNNAEIDGSIYYEGTHIVKVINNISYFRTMLKRLNAILEIFIDIKNNPLGVSPKLKEILTKAGIANLQHNIINSYIASILKDQSMLIKNALIMKYFLELNDASESNIKPIAETVYSIVMYCNLLSLSNERKSIELITDIIKEKNMQEKLFEKITNMTKLDWLMKNVIGMQFRVDENSVNDSQQFKAKMFASIYNFFQIKNGKIVIRGNNFSKLTDYLNSYNEFSIEHFLINESGKYVIMVNDKEFSCCYPQNIFLLKDDIFNFIFVPKEINEQILKNNFISKKIELLKPKLSEIKCDYTRMYLELAEGTFENYVDSLTEEDNIERKINSKFILDFDITDYPEFKKKILNKFIERINN